jgi:hypothetical protein
MMHRTGWDKALPMLDKPSGVLGAAERAVLRASGPMSMEDEDVMVIAASGLFDETWYIRENPDVARSGINPLLHYVRHGAGENRAPFPGFNAVRYIANVEVGTPIRRNPLAHYILNGSPDDLLSKGMLREFSMEAIKVALVRLNALKLFRPDDYLQLNQDVKPIGGIEDVRPDNHALVSGFPAGRKVFLETTVARVMGEAARKPVPPPAAFPGAAPKLPPIGVFFSAAGNAFLREIAEDIAASLVSAGQDVRLLDDLSDIAARPPLCIFIAPHEFFHIGNGRAWAREEILRGAIMFTTEQPQTLWFERSLPFVLMARAVIDISWQVHDILGGAGIPALHFNPAVTRARRWLRDEDAGHPLLRTLPKALRAPNVPFIPFPKRQIDFSFFGTASEHREKFFAKNAWFLAQYEAFLYYRKVESPLAPKGAHAALARLAGHVTAHSKISLNIHRDPNGFFEWHRIAKMGIGGGAVVVSEPCDPHPLYRPGVHYLEESGRHILDLIEWLVRTPDGQAHAVQIQANGRALLADQTIAERNNLALLGFLAEHA